MKIQKSLILLMVLALIAVTGGTLTWFKRHQKLGQPGIKATPIPGSVAMKIDLPAKVLDFTSTNVQESDVELGYFPKDTSFVERWYTSPDGSPGISATVILMGADRTSIHRPEYCLVARDSRVIKKRWWTFRWRARCPTGRSRFRILAR